MALTSLESRLAAAITARHGSLIDDLRTFVNIPTGMGHRAGLDETRERLVARCAALGATSDLFPGDPRPTWLDSRAIQAGRAVDVTPTDDAPPTVVCRNTKPNAPAVLIAGHLDTVHDPRGSFIALTTDAANTRATGPGCVDMKGGLVIAMHALEALAEIGAPASWSFMLNSDEETGSFHSDRALRAEAASGRYRAGIALEPAMSKGELAISRGGSGQFMLHAHGRQAHVGRDFAAGRSATSALCDRVLKAHALSDAGAGVCVNISPLHCDQPTNVVSDSALAWGNVRYPTPETGAALRARLESLNDAPDAMPRVEVRTTFNRPAKPLTPQTESLALAARGVAEALGQQLPFNTTAGVCDGNNLQAAGLPTIDTLGVRGGGLHTLDEWIDLTSLVERCQLLAILIHRLSNA
jgi:glutamate carboxypeptidase